MNMKKNILLSMILLALCLIQASANYYYKIRLYKDNGEVGGWTSYIEVRYDDQQKVYHNGLSDLIDGKTVKEGKTEYTLPKKDDKTVDLDKIYGIVFANEKGRFGKGQENILEGNEWNAWLKIRSHIKQLELREYELDAYNNSGYFMDMSNLEALELPKGGMKVGNGDKDGELYFANANELKIIYLYKEGAKDDKVEITDDKVKDNFLLDRV